MPTPVLATKLFPPAPRRQLVGRPRLLAQLDATLEPSHRLTVLAAPAGFGKTTLLGDWLGHLQRTAGDTRVAWLALDGGDNDVGRFLTHLVAALAKAGLAVGDVAVDGAATAQVLTGLVNTISDTCERAPETTWLVLLDDYHVVVAADVLEATAFLLDHLPAQVHLVVATRADPSLPLARLRARGQLTEVRAAELRFTTAEAREFLNRVMGLELSTAEVQALDDRTEGWAAGLQLAALSLRGVAEPEEVAGFISAFTGSSRFVIDYLADEVLARQSEEIRAFLLRTAVLDQLTGSLCDAVTGRTDGTRTLVDLDRDNLFLVPLDSQRVWYRYHHMFGDVLRARLLADHPGEVADLHRMASDWYAASDLAVDAVRHALAAEDFDRAGHLMQEALPEMRRTRQDGVMLGWVRSLPEDVVRRSPVLCLIAAWSRLVTGDLDGVESRLDDAEAALAVGREDPELAATWAENEDLRTAPATVLVYRASVAQARGDVAGTAQHARRALDLAGPEDHFVRGAAGGFLGLAAWAAGDVTTALATFSDAVRSLHAAGNLVDELDATVVLADLWVAAGQPSRARRLYEKGLRTATSGSAPYPRATADLHVGLAELDRETGDLAGAEEHLETARALADRGSITENRHRWYVVMALVRADRGAFDAAQDLLDEAEALYRPGFYPEVRPIPAIRARLHLAQGDLAAAQEWARERDVSTADPAAYLREFDHLTLVRLDLARHRGEPSALEDTMALLDRLYAAAEPDRHGSLIEIGLLLALVHEARGDRELALAELDRVRTRAPEPEALVLPGEARRILDGDRRPAPGALADPLSGRETEVLRLLDSELTGPEIARQLYVSLNTLRTHTKSIFTKLDVSSRAAAVRRGRQLGLL